MAKPDIAVERLKELLHYDPDTGVFTRIAKSGSKGGGGKSKIGAVAGCVLLQGYRIISLDSTDYKAHRLAWLYVHGVWPHKDIDHINGVKDDNRISNLREATRSENLQNAGNRKGRDKSSRGASYKKDCNRWEAQIQVNKHRQYLGLFATQEEAHRAYAAAKLKYHTFSPVAYSQK